MVDDSGLRPVRQGRGRMRSRRIVALGVLAGAWAAATVALAAPASVGLTAVGVRIGNHPAFVRAVVDFTRGSVANGQVEAADPKPFDGTASLRLAHANVQTGTSRRSADGITVDVVQGSGQLRIDVRAARGRFKYLSYAVVKSDRLAIDLWKSAPPSSVAAEVRDGRGDCLTLDRVQVRTGVVSAAGREHNLFEHQFQLVLRGADGRVLAQRLVHNAGRWSAQVSYRAISRQAGTLEAVAFSAKDGALVCLVQVRVGLPPSTARPRAANAVATVGGPVPPRTTATSVTLISSRTGFVLGTAPCAHRPCTVILHTTDRGRSWRGLPAPLEAVSAPYGTGLWGVRFADARRGYAYGDGMWVTDNGSASWQRAPVPEPIVFAFATVADREVVMATASCRPDSGGCAHRLTLYRRSITAAKWQRVVTVGPNAFDATIAVHRDVVWVLIAKRLFVSTDGGRTFSSHAQPCHNSTGSAFREPSSVTDDGPHTYLLCIGQGFTGHTLKYVYQTAGTASGWILTGKPPAAGVGGALAAGSDRALIIATSSAASWLDRSTDRGGHWRTALTYSDGGEGWGDLGFTTPFDGVVIHGPATTDGGNASRPGQLLLTDDGGRTWQTVRF